MQNTLAKVMLMSSLILSTSLNAADLCLDAAGQAKIATAIKDLEKCHVDLDAKNQLIHERLETFAGAPALAWWQEPSAIIGGTVVSFSLGAALVYYVTRK